MTSKHNGVCWDRSRSRWKARVRINNRIHTVGTFFTEDEAARAREVFARKNFPPALAERGIHGNRKLDDTDVVVIRERVKQGRPHSAIAREFGVTPHHIYQVAAGRRRANVQ